MRKFFCIAVMAAATLLQPLSAADQVYELRIYHCNPGKLDALLARFRNHTTKLFEKHGMKNVGYWVPQDEPKETLYYILAHPNREEAMKHWKEFQADQDWVKVKTESEANGKIVAKVDRFFLNPTDFSKLK